MKLKIDSRSLRFKITGDELQKLRAGDALEEVVNIAGRKFSFVINSVGSSMVLNYEGDVICLTVSPELIEDLAGKGLSKEGIKSDIDGLTVFLQVDARTMP